MSTVNNGPQIVKTSLAFVLDPSVSAGYIKTPKQISNCIAWFDGNDSDTMTLSSNIASAWADKSGNNNTLNSAQLSNLPAGGFSPLYTANAVNGLGSVYFDGSNDYMFVNSGMGLASAVGYTSFIVLSPRYLNAQQVAVGLQTSSGTYDFLAWWLSLDTFRIAFDGGGNGQTNTTSRNDNRPIIHSIVRNGTSANAYLNNLQYATNVTVASTVNSGVARLGVGAGTYSNGTDPYKGYVCEIIIYNRALSTTERSQVQNYLSNKWRIPLSQTTLTNRDLIFGKVATCQNNNIPVIDKSYRLNPANTSGSPIQSNFYFADPVSWMSSVVTTTITLEAWVKPNSFTFYGTSGTDLGTIMIANSNFYLSIDGNGKFNTYLIGSAGNVGGSHLPSTTSVTRHAWNHVVVTFDGAYIRWYLNGVLDKTSSTTYTLGTLLLTNYLGIGSEGAAGFGRNLDGYVAGCKIYGKALTTAEVSQNYESSKTEFSNLPNMVATNVRCYYDLDIYSSYFGSGLVDLSGGGYTATINNSPTYASTEPKCFILNGSTQDITLPSNFNNGLTSATWEFWVNCASLPTTGVIQQIYIQEASVWLALYNAGVGAFFGCDLNNGTSWFDGNGGINTGAKTTSTLSANTWYHITYSWNGSVKIYLNGNLESTTSTGAVTILGAGTTPRSIGSRSGSYFNGKISMFRNYNASLSAAEVLQNYNATKFRFGL